MAQTLAASPPASLASRALRWYDYITVNIYFLGLTTLSQTNGVVFPLLVQMFVGEENKGEFFGRLRLWSLMVAVLAQAFWGMLSDRSTLPGGRRRPFILMGTLGNITVFLVMVVVASGMEGMAGYIFLFAMSILSQATSNMGQAAQQGLIPDLVPENRRGTFSGIKAILEIPLPMILVAVLIGPIIKGGNLWGGIIAALVVMGISMGLAMLVPEKRLEKSPEAIDWGPIARLLLMTALFAGIILAVGEAAKWVGRAVENVSSTWLIMLAMGLSGLVAMVIAVGLGVWLSVRISIGEGVKRYPSFGYWVINRLAFLVGVTNISTFTVYFLQGRLGLVETEAAEPALYLSLAVGACILLSVIPSGVLADRLGKKKLVAISGFTAALGTLIALLAPNMIVIYIGGAFIGIATGLFFSANWALGTELVPKAEAARYLGISNLAGAGAGAVGAYIGGPIADKVDKLVPAVPGAGYVLLFGIFLVLFLLSTVPLLWIKEGEVQDSEGLKAEAL